MTLQFIVPGRPVSNNRVTRRFGNRSVKSGEARTYQQLVFQHAFAKSVTVGWEKPEACRVTITAFNVTIDIDNIAKCVLDGMHGAAYDDDKCVVDLQIQKFKDHDGQRIVVAVESAPVLVKPKRRKAA